MIDEKNQVVWKELEAIHPYYSDIDEWGKPHKDIGAFHEYQRRWLRTHALYAGKDNFSRGPALTMKSGDARELTKYFKDIHRVPILTKLKSLLIGIFKRVNT